MKAKNWLKKLLIAVPVVLLVICFASGGAGIPDRENVKASLQLILTLISIMMCVGAMGFVVSGGSKPLDWIIVGSFLGTFICFFEVLGISSQGIAAKLLLWPFLIELVLSAGYRISKHTG